eukprot:6361078-Pyramimonas_sp.AAC.1
MSPVMKNIKKADSVNRKGRPSTASWSRGRRGGANGAMEKPDATLEESSLFRESRSAGNRRGTQGGPRGRPKP